MKIKNFYDQDTATFTYVVSDDKTGKCAVIDSVLNYDIFSGRTNNFSADLVISYIQENKLELEWILETHIHADHLTAATYIKEKLGGKVGIGSSIKEVLKFWVPFFNIENETPTDGSQFDKLFDDGENFLIGNLQVKVIHTPGHTPACVSYLIENSIFTGDIIFMPQIGTARTDFPGGSAKTLFASIQKILNLPENTEIFVGHDYPESNQKPTASITVAKQKQENVLVNDSIDEEKYVAMRNKRDQGKSIPKLLLPSIQFNIRSGSFGKAEENGVCYIRIPVNKI